MVGLDGVVNIFVQLKKRMVRLMVHLMVRLMVRLMVHKSYGKNTNDRGPQAPRCRSLPGRAI